MAGIFANVDSDINKLRQLKAEIENIKKALKSINVKVDIDIAKGMEAQLKSLMGQYDALVKKVSEAEGEIIISSKKASESYIKQQKDIDGLIQKYEELSKIINQIPSQPPQTPSPTKPSSGGRPRGPKTYTDAEIDAALNTQVNSIKAAREQLKVLRFAVAEVTDEEEKSNRTRTKLNAKIQENTQYLKENSDAYTKQKMNIGSYERDIRKALKGNESLNISFSKLLATVGGIAVFKQLATEIVTVRGQFQQLEIAFSTMLKSKEKADKLMAELVDIAAKTPFDLQGVASSAKQMLAYGSQAENVGDELIMLGNVAAGVGAQLSEIAYLYGTLRTQGRAYAVDIRQFAGRGIPIYEELAKVLGVTKDEVAGFVTAGKVGFKEVEQAFKNMTSESGIYYNLMQEQSKSLTGQISNLGDAWDTMLNNIGKGTQGIASAGISGLKYLVENYENVGKILVSLVAAYGAYRTAIMLSTVAASKHTLAEIALINVRVLARKAQLALNAAMLTNPYVVIATAIGGLVAALFMFTKTTKSVEDVLTDLDNATNNFSKNVNNVDTLISEYEQLSTKTNRTKDENDRLNTVMNTLASTVNNVGAKFDEYGNIIDVNIEKVKEFSEAQKEALRIDLTASISKAKESVKKIDKDILAQQRIFKEGIYTKTRWVGAQFYGSYEEFESPATEEQKTEAAKKVNELYAKRSELIDKITSAEKVLSGISVEETTETIGEASVSTISSEIEQITERIKILNQEISDLRSGRMQVKVGETVESVIEAKEKELQNAQKSLETLTGGKSTGSDTKEISSQQKLFDDLLQLRFQNQQDEINLMADGAEKRRKQIELDYRKEYAEIRKLEKEWTNQYGGKLTQEQTIEISRRYTNADKKYASEMFGIDTESIDSEEAKYQKLLSEYQDYLTKRKEAENKYNADRKILEERGASQEQIDELEYQRNEALEAIDNEFAMREDTFQAWMDDIANFSIERLKEALVQAEQELAEVEQSGVGGQGLAVARAKVNTARRELSTKEAKKSLSPDKRSKKEWMDLYNTLQKVNKQFEEIGDTVGGVAGEIISTAGSISASTLQMVDGIVTIANSSSEAISETGEVTEKTLSTVEKASLILTVITAALQIATKIASLFTKQSTYEKYEETKEVYESYISLLDKVIEKHLELAESLSGMNANAAYDKAIETLKLQEEAARTLGKQYLDSREKREHTKGYKEVEEMSAEGWAQAANAMGISVSAFQGMMGGRMTGLFDLSAEQLKKLQEEAPLFIANLDSETQDYINAIIEGGEKLDEVWERQKENFTGISFDSLKDNFISALSDMKSSSKDFTDDFEEMMRDAIIRSFVNSEEFQKKLQEWHDSFSAAMSDGKLSEDEKEQLQKDYNELVDWGINYRDSAFEAMGFNPSSSGQQSASSRGFETMSQDAADELNGRFTAVYESNLRIEMATQQQTMAITELKGPITAFNETSKGIYNIADETRTILANSYLELQQIRENTGEIVKPIKQIQTDIAEVRRNTAGLVS